MPSEADLKMKTAEAGSLEAQLKQTEERIAALSVEVKNKRAAMQDAFIAAHEKRFAALNLPMILIGGTGPGTEHEVKVGTASFWLSPPSGEMIRLTEAFTLAPNIEVPGVPAGPGQPVGPPRQEDLGPVMPYELILMQWVIGSKLGESPRQAMTNRPIPQRLKVLRMLPALLMRKLATEADDLHNYLALRMERELGN